MVMALPLAISHPINHIICSRCAMMLSVDWEVAKQGLGSQDSVLKDSLAVVIDCPKAPSITVRLEAN